MEIQRERAGTIIPASTMLRFRTVFVDMYGNMRCIAASVYQTFLVRLSAMTNLVSIQELGII